MRTADFLVIGGGIAGVSAAANLAPHATTIVLEAEPAFGYHSSGRSATFSHLGIGNGTVRGLTAYSHAFLENSAYDGISLSQADTGLFVARSAMMNEFHALEREMRRFSDKIERIDEQAIADLVPVLRCGSDAIVAGLLDRSARRIDSEALQQSYRATVKHNGGECVRNARVVSINRDGGSWTVETEAGDIFSAGVLINAAGSWCDDIARLAGLEVLGLRPLRRTIIAFAADAGLDAMQWPFTKTAVDDFYMLPQSGMILASPVDEVPSLPGDAQPDDYDIALAASKVEEYTTMKVARISQLGWPAYFYPRSYSRGRFRARCRGLFLARWSGGIWIADWTSNG